MAIHALNFADKTWTVDVADKNLIAELESKPAPASRLDSASLIRNAIKNPIGSAPLHELVHKGDKVCLIIPDVTRLWQHPDVYTPLMVEALNEAGIADEDITIVSATGTHRKQTEAEHISLVGADIVKRIRIVDHQCHEHENMVHVGTTSRGTEVYYNKVAVEADKIVTCCGVVFHFLAGYGGAAKMLLPGVASYETIQAHHKLSLNEGLGSGANPQVQSGNFTASNPFHADMVEAALMLAPCFSLNVVTDDHGIIAAYAGDWQKAHYEGCKMVHEKDSVQIPELAPLVIASAGGYPKDINLYQTIKLLSNALAAVKPGGTMILLSSCYEGFGSPDVERLLTQYPNMLEREKEIRRAFSIASYVGYLFAEAAEKVNFILVTDMDKELFAATKITAVKTLDEALEVAKSLNNGSLDMKTILMPHGATTLPVLMK